MKTIPLHDLLNRILLETPNEHKEALQNFIEQLLDGYAPALGVNKTTLFNVLENYRRAEEEDPLRFYCDYRFPSASRVEFFEDFEDFYDTYPSKQYICSHCREITPHPYECQAENACGYHVQEGTAAGKVLRLTFKHVFLEKPGVDLMFLPWEKKE